MIKVIDSMTLDTNKLRDLAGSLAQVTSYCLKLKPVLESLSKPVVQGQVIPDMKWRTEGGVSVLEQDLLQLQVALNDARRRVGPAIKFSVNKIMAVRIDPNNL